jgi:ATP adenylyltransferase
MTPNILWAPWRIAYIKNAKQEKECLFCRVHRSKNDVKNFVYLRLRSAFGILNLYPYNNGHVMIAPSKHVKSLADLSDNELCDIMACAKKTTAAIDKILKPEGYNIGINMGRAAGAGIDNHLHIHIVPRWNGDTNFMPVLTGTKVISQSLSDLYGRLVQKIGRPI